MHDRVMAMVRDSVELYKERKDMTEAKHTPGPWSVVPTEPDDKPHKPRTVTQPVGPDSPHKYRLADVYAWGSHAERDANARLIAVAPDLLEACQELIFHLPCAPDNHAGHRAFKKAKAAIAKAIEPNKAPHAQT